MRATDRVRWLGTVVATAVVGLALGGCGGSGSTGSTGSSGSSGSTASTGPSGSTTGTGAASGTGAATTPATSTTGSSSSSPGPARRRHRHAVVIGPRVGARQAVHTDGTDLTVTIVRVLGLTHTGSPSLPGTRQVGVELRIANQQGATYDSTASGDVSLVLSAGRSEPLDVRRGVCQTPLQDFESIVSAGSVRTGCVAFSVPRRSRVIGVRFSPHSRPRGRLTWRTG